MSPLQVSASLFTLLKRGSQGPAVFIGTPLATPKVDIFASFYWAGLDTSVKTVHALALQRSFPTLAEESRHAY